MRALAELGRELPLDRVALTGLGDDEVGALISALGGPAVLRAAGRRDAPRHRRQPAVRRPAPAPPRTAALLVERAGELRLRAAGAPLGVPGRAKELVGHPARGADAPIAATLRIAAVIGRTFGHELVGRGRRRPGRGGARRARGGRPPSGSSRSIGAGRYAFVHALVREAIYEQTGAARRASLHRRVAEALERPAATRTRRARPPLPRRRGPRARTRVLGQQRTARARPARLRGRGGPLPRARSTALGDDDREQRCELLLALGDALGPAGQPRGVEAHVPRGGRRSPRTLERPELLARAAVGYGGRLVWEVSRDDRDLVPAPRARARPHRRGRQPAAGPAARPARRRPAARRARPARRRAITERGARHGAPARRPGDARLRPRRLHLRAPFAGLHAAAGRARDGADRARRSGRATSSGRSRPTSTGPPRGWSWATRRGCVADVEADGAARRRAAPARPGLVRGRAPRGAGAARRAAGRRRGADAPRRCGSGADAPTWNAVVCHLLQLVVLRRLQGRLDEVEAARARPRRSTRPRYPVCRCAHAHVLAALGRHDEARARAGRALRDDLAPLALRRDVARLARVPGRDGAPTLGRRRSSPPRCTRASRPTPTGWRSARRRSPSAPSRATSACWTRQPVARRRRSPRPRGGGRVQPRIGARGFVALTLADHARLTGDPALAGRAAAAYAELGLAALAGLR